MAKRIMSNSRVKTQTMLDELPPGSVVLDKFGHAWQSDRTYWYRAYGDEIASSWDLSFSGPFVGLVVARGE